LRTGEAFRDAPRDEEGGPVTAGEPQFQQWLHAGFINIARSAWGTRLENTFGTA
jgi:hypothetical protein